MKLLFFNKITLCEITKIKFKYKNMSDDVICLSSDDDLESLPPKRLKLNNAVGTEVFAKLNKLRDITTTTCGDKASIKCEESHLTIIIDSVEKNGVNSKKPKFVDDIVNLVDEPLENAVEIKDLNNSSECLIVASDSENEDKLLTLDSETEEKSSSDPESVQNGTETNDQETPVMEENVLLNRPSTSKASDAHKLLDEFLDTCKKSLKGSKYESKVLPKFLKMKKNFEKCENMHEEPHLMKMLQDYIGTAKISAAEAVVSFQRIYSFLLDYANGTSIEVPEENLSRLKKLEKTIKRITKRINKMENMELNFDDEEDSIYIQIDRWSNRLNQVYKKYCQLLNRSPNAGRLLYERVQYVSSKYNEINRAVTKACKSNNFPSYYDMEKCIKKCVSKHNLVLSDADIKAESKMCFETIGKLLQMRRKKELYEVHAGFIALNEDPASKDEGLKIKLQESMKEGEKNMKEVMEKYVRMQDNNVSVEISEDSDDSSYKDSGSDTNETVEA